MTIEQARNLCALAYFDPPDNRYTTLRELCTALLNAPLPCRPPSEIERGWIRHLRDALGHWRYLACIDRNAQTGFFAYAFGIREGSVLIAFRGSEAGNCAPNAADWVDNFLAPLCGSMQYMDVEHVLALFPTQSLTLVGHSKGGHNALYAKALARRPAKCIAFNAQGFARAQLTPIARRRLRKDTFHYVVRGDLVGVLLRHPEPRIFVRPCCKAGAHSLQSFSFDAIGAPILARRPLVSYGFELFSRLVLRSDARRSKLCASYLARTPADRAFPGALPQDPG